MGSTYSMVAGDRLGRSIKARREHERLQRLQGCGKARETGHGRELQLLTRQGNKKQPAARGGIDGQQQLFTGGHLAEHQAQQPPIGDGKDRQELSTGVQDTVARGGTDEGQQLSTGDQIPAPEHEPHPPAAGAGVKSPSLWKVRKEHRKAEKALQVLKKRQTQPILIQTFLFREVHAATKALAKAESLMIQKAVELLSEDWQCTSATYEPEEDAQTNTVRYVTERRGNVDYLHTVAMLVAQDWHCLSCHKLFQLDLPGNLLQLPCDHVHHLKCIRSVLTGQSDCPECHQEFEFVKNAKHSDSVITDNSGPSEDEQVVDQPGSFFAGLYEDLEDEQVEDQPDSFLAGLYGNMEDNMPGSLVEEE